LGRKFINEYVDKFLSLKCSGDVLNSVSKSGKSEKEITESMAIIKHLKKIVLLEPMKYTVVDLCAGNALTSVLSAFMFPVKEAIAVDKNRRKGHYENVKRFVYYERNISEEVERVNERNEWIKLLRDSLK
jgi:hypothetical protein